MPEPEAKEEEEEFDLNDLLGLSSECSDAHALLTRKQPNKKGPGLTRAISKDSFRIDLCFVSCEVQFLRPASLAVQKDSLICESVYHLEKLVADLKAIKLSTPDEIADDVNADLGNTNTTSCSPTEGYGDHPRAQVTVEEREPATGVDCGKQYQGHNDGDLPGYLIDMLAAVSAAESRSELLKALPFLSGSNKDALLRSAGLLVHLMWPFEKYPDYFKFGQHSLIEPRETAPTFRMTALQQLTEFNLNESDIIRLEHLLAATKAKSFTEALLTVFQAPGTVPVNVSQVVTTLLSVAASEVIAESHGYQMKRLHQRFHKEGGSELLYQQEFFVKDNQPPPGHNSS
eukprot:sb/3466363/